MMEPVRSDSYGRGRTGALCPLSSLVPQLVVVSLVKPGRGGAAFPEPVLARMKHPLVTSSEETIAQALTGDWRVEHLFTLRQAVELYDTYQQKIEICDQEIESYMKTRESRRDPQDLPPRGSGSRRKNQVPFDLRRRLYAWTGVDLTTLPGLDAMTAQTVLRECGPDMSRFATEKHYSSWLGLCPNHQITGGKVRRRRRRKVQNRAARALRVAAQSLHKSKSALGAYYRRMHGRCGPAKAITATAHKLAILIYRMLKHGMKYVEQGQQVYEQQYQQRTRRMLAKRVREMGYAMVDPEISGYELGVSLFAARFPRRVLRCAACLGPQTRNDAFGSPLHSGLWSSVEMTAAESKPESATECRPHPPHAKIRVST
jgi:transposase